MSRSQFSEMSSLHGAWLDQSMHLASADEQRLRPAAALQADLCHKNELGMQLEQPSASAVATAMSLCAGLGYEWALHMLYAP